MRVVRGFFVKKMNSPTNFEIECKRGVVVHVIFNLEYQFELEYVKDSDSDCQMGMIA